MELDRKSIQKQDFSSSRRGYDPAEVDRHLAAIADAVDELKRSTTAGAAAERVKGIIEAAEQSAAEIESAARDKAGAVGDELAEAERRRDEARAEAEEQLRRAEKAAELLGAAVGELDRVRSALAGLPKPSEPRSASRAHTAILERPAEEEGPDAAAAAPAAGAAAAGSSEPAPVAARVEPSAAEEAPESPAEAAHEASPPAAGGGAGSEGARLIALNMALNGTPRDETARYLAENFELDDADALLDDVYSRAR